MGTKLKPTPTFGYPCCGECSFCHADKAGVVKCFFEPPQFIAFDSGGDAVFVRGAPVDARDPICSEFDHSLKAH